MITSTGLRNLGFVSFTDYVLQDDGDGVYIREWNSASPQPTEAEIESAHNEWKAEYDAQEYARNRATAYASIGDQLDMQYWDSVNDTTTWKDHVASVKNQYPKP
jgi:hypothetical protein|tara:strand:+ start:729 stop:1040 length:312 start_codon:yes stop_codon:yes gene_type:complete